MDATNIQSLTLYTKESEKSSTPGPLPRRGVAR